MKNTIDVSIIIPNLDSPVIDRVQEALKGQCASVEEEIEVLVVGLDSPNLVKEIDRVRFISTGKPVPPSRARNIGAEKAQGRTLIFIDADCIPTGYWLKEMLAASEHWKDAGAISGAMLPTGMNYASIGTQISCFHEHLNLNQKGRRCVLASFSLLMIRDVWDKSGGFDPVLAIAEDVDLSVRLSQLGYLLYLNPKATVYHLHNRNTLGQLWRHAIKSGRHSIRIRRRHRKWFGMTWAHEKSWLWRVFSPVIALIRTIQIYMQTPGLWRYCHYFPCVILNKLGWCLGAAREIETVNNER